ncbi:MAG TPA: hypothetical protein VHA70_08615 [Bauldia sp.]|nr:hypothetical protein [Bauldia sp.]
MSFDTPSLRCRECKFWWPLPHGGVVASREKSVRGQCRRYAPPAYLIGSSEPDVGNIRRPMWAVVAKEDWCGEFIHRAGV